MSTGPFAPPAERERDAVGRIGGALVPWIACGAVIGTGVGFTLHMTGELRGASAAAGVAGAAGGLVLGWLVVRLERARAADLPGLPGAGWPVHGAVRAVPLAALVPASLWLGLVSAVGLANLAPVVFAGAAVLGIAWALVRVWSDHRLVVALQAQAADRPDEARTALSTLAQHPLATARARRLARLNLGALLLSAGELSAAAHWLALVPDAAVAGAGLAVARVGLGQVDAASEAVSLAMRCADAGRARAEVDAARVLVLWKTEGADAARELADRLDGPGAGRLFRDLRARLHGESPPPGPLLAKLGPALGL